MVEFTPALEFTFSSQSRYLRNMHSTSFWAAEVPDPGSEYILQTKYFPEYYCISPDWLAAYAHICLLSVVSVSLYTPDNKKTYAHCKKTALHFSLYAISQMQTKYLSHENNRITRFRNFFNFFPKFFDDFWNGAICIL